MMKGFIFTQQQQQQHQQQHHQQQVLEENMSNLTSAASGEASVSSGNNIPQPYFATPSQSQAQQQQPQKRKRNLPGNPDPDAEVIALSPKTLMATNRFVCEICNKGFQRDQNLQLHRRGHNLPWKLKQRNKQDIIRKKVYVCPETSCVHHEPARALGDLTGIKKHFSRKHGEKKWKCEKCSKKYAVQSDWKAHSKTCGTREYRCDCGTLFSRRDSFITHRAFCDALAEESARAITGTNPIIGSSSLHVPQLDIHGFTLKKEQQQQQNFSLPPWLASQPLLGGAPQALSSIDHHHHHHHLSSSSSSIFNNHQEHHQFTQTHQDLSLHQNPNLGGGPTNAAFHHQTVVHAAGGVGAASPHMSATALLQKAAQMGATMSNNKTSTSTGSLSSSSPAGGTGTGTAALMRPHQVVSAAAADDNSGLNLYSREGFAGLFGNKAAAGGGGGDGGADCSGGGGAQLLQEMMNSLSSGDHGYDGSTSSFDELGFGGILDSKKAKTTSNDNNGGGGGEELTRDFLGLRAFSQSDILNIAGFGNCINNNEQQHNQSQKPWQ